MNRIESVKRRPATSADSAATRERILDAALACYRERGIGATSLQAVARRAEVSAATVLNHFGSAEELARVLPIDTGSAPDWGSLLPALSRLWPGAPRMDSPPSTH